MDSVFLLIDIFVLRIILLLMTKGGLILKKIIKFFKLLKRRIDILSAENELKFLLEKNSGIPTLPYLCSSSICFSFYWSYS